MKKALLIIYFVNVTVFLVHSQYKEGYIIYNNNDTAYGYIYFHGSVNNSKECFYKKTIEGEEIKYLPGEIKGYRFIKGKYFISHVITVDNLPKIVFLEWLIKGKASILTYSASVSNPRYFIKLYNDSLYELKNSIQIQSDNNLQYIVEKKEFIGALKYYFSDCPEIFPEVQNSYLSDNSLINLAKEYHNKTCKDQECIVFEDKSRKLLLNIGPSLAYFNSQVNLNNNMPENFNLSKSFGFGIMINISNFPVISTNFSIQTNIEYFINSYNYDVKNEINLITSNGGNFILNPNTYKLFQIRLIRVPVQLKYSFPLNNFRPFISVGFAYNYRVYNTITFPDLIYYLTNHYSDFRFLKNQISFTSGIGIDYKFASNLNFELGVGYEKTVKYIGMYPDDTSNGTNLLYQIGIMYKIKD